MTIEEYVLMSAVIAAGMAVYDALASKRYVSVAVFFVAYAAYLVIWPIRVIVLILRALKKGNK